MIIDDFVEDIDQIVGRTTSRKDDKLPGGKRFGLEILAVLDSEEIHFEEETLQNGTLQPYIMRLRLLRALLNEHYLILQ